MKSKIIEHALSILLLTCAFVLAMNTIKEKESVYNADRVRSVGPYLRLDSLDFGNPLHVALFKETLNLFHPDTPARNDSLLQAIQAYRQEQFSNLSYKTGGDARGLTSAKMMNLGNMYGQFIIIYLIVMILSYYAAQSLAILRFMKMKQHRTSYLEEFFFGIQDAHVRDAGFLVRSVLLLAKAVAKGASYAILFSPAYVIAYSIRSSIDTDSYLFMIVLGVLSNGLLINYANKFFTFLVTESRKGYVQTAIVKNLNASYEWGTPTGVSYWSVVRPGSSFPSHVFRHIYMNAHFQFLSTLKEHASFLITGLVIIEMALNIQGHLGYELLQNILYKQYDVVLGIILGIFLIVKVTELVVDMWLHYESRKYENRT